MEINYFDLVSAVIILLLGLKGILNGFFKEVFGLVGIIGGVFVASRVGDTVGEYLNNLIFNFSSPAAVKFLGFLTALTLFWIIMILLGQAFKKLSSLSGLGPLDKIFGFIIGASKFFLIASILAYSISNIKALKSSLDSALETSVLFPVMVETGGVIIQMDPADLNTTVNNTIAKGEETLKKQAQELANSATKEQIEEIKKELSKNIEKQVKEK